MLLLTFSKQMVAQMNAGDLKEKVAKLGRAGLLAYGLFNAITYTTFFFIAFLAFEKTGQNPANNLKACLGVSIDFFSCSDYTPRLDLFSGNEGY